jgi:cob(I)alamin adenosyltransferase
MIKKLTVALVASSVFLLANDTTITATMGLMSQGLSQLQSGFMYNKKDDIVKGISILKNANSIFSEVDVSTFIPNNNKIQVTRNINENMQNHLNQLSANIASKSYFNATESYGKVMKDCMSCHKIIRGW